MLYLNLTKLLAWIVDTVIAAASKTVSN